MAKYGTFLEHLSRIEGYTDEEAIVEFAKHGLDFIECDWAVLRKKPQAFFDLLKNLSVEISIYISVDKNGNLNFERETLAKDELEKIVALGIKDVMLVCRANEGENPKSKEMEEQIIASVSAFMDKALPLGIQVTMEDFDSLSIPCGSCADLLRYGNRLPALRYTFDTGNFLMHSEDVLNCLPLLKDKVTHVHAKDRVDLSTHAQNTVTGTGVIPIKRILKELFESGFDGMIAAEFFTKKMDKDDLLQSLAFIRNVGKENGR